MRSQLIKCQEKEKRNKIILGQVTGEMKAQLELSRKLLGPRAILFESFDSYLAKQ